MDRSLRGILAAVVLVTLVSAPLFAREARVTRHNGQQLTGELVAEDDNTVTLRISDIDTAISREDILRVEYLKTPEQRYIERRAELDDNDLNGRYELAVELFNEKSYGLSRQELVRLNEDFPSDERVSNLLTVVQQRIKLANEPKANAVTRPPRGAPTTARRDRPGPDGEPDSGLLTDEQINLIRVYEIDLEQQPRVIISEETLETFFKEYADEQGVPGDLVAQRAFQLRPGHEQLDLFFKVKARDLYSEIQVPDDPPTMRTFRRTVHPVYVSRYFLETFGSGQIDGLQLFGSTPNRADEAYTNFYVLDSFSYEGKRMIDRQEPEASLLLQWGLPREVATYRAPEVEGWRPFFTGPTDPKFLEYAQWIESLYDPRPDYGIEYHPDGAPAPEQVTPEESSAEMDETTTIEQTIDEFIDEASK